MWYENWKQMFTDDFIVILWVDQHCEKIGHREREGLGSGRTSAINRQHKIHIFISTFRWTTQTSQTRNAESLSFWYAICRFTCNINHTWQSDIWCSESECMPNIIIYFRYIKATVNSTKFLKDLNSGYNCMHQSKKSYKNTNIKEITILKGNKPHW